MSKEYLESLNKIQHDFGQLKGQELVSCYETIFNALKRLESIDNAEPSEALECLEWVSHELKTYYEHLYIILLDSKEELISKKKKANEYLEHIKQALLKAQKEHKALDTIKKFIWVEDGKLKCGRYGDIEIELEEEDFESKDELDLLKEVLGC